MPKKKVTLSLDAQTYSKFQKYCQENAIILSKKVEIFMNNFLEDKNQKGDKKKK